MVSRRHATLSFRNGKYFLKDLGSSNGTLVNEARVAQDDEVEVGHGTVVQVENTREKTYNSTFKAIHYCMRKYFSKNRTDWESLLSINHRVWVAWYPVQNHRRETLLQQD